MITLEAITKSYGNTHVLKGIDASIQPGDFITIVGASGAGKSTLLHLLAGLDRPTDGRITFDGQDLRALDEKGLNKLRNYHVGLVFQFHNLLPELSALDNVLLPRWIAKQTDAAAREEALNKLTDLGLGDRADHLPKELSGGEQQRVAIARALINHPKLLLADEPTGNLDSENAKAVHELLVELNEVHGQTLVVVTHNEALAALGKKRWVMKDGKLVSE